MMRVLAADLRSGARLGAAPSQDGRRSRCRLLFWLRGDCRLRPAAGFDQPPVRLACRFSASRPEWAANSCRRLNEGSLLFMPTFVPATALTEVKRVMAWQDRVIARNARRSRSSPASSAAPIRPTDPAPIEMIETTIMLKPQSEWRPGMTKQGLVNELTREAAAGARCCARFPPADREPRPDDLHRHSRAGRREDPRRQSRRASAKGLRGGAGRAQQFPARPASRRAACRESRISRSK